MASVANLTLTKKHYFFRMPEFAVQTKVSVSDQDTQVSPTTRDRGVHHFPTTRDQVTDAPLPSELAPTEAANTERMGLDLLRMATNVRDAIVWDAQSVNPACMEHLNQASAILDEVVLQDRVTLSQRPRGK